MSHSPLGGSVASRFIACPGSHWLIQSLGGSEADPLNTEEWRNTGSAAHELAAEALNQRQDAWELLDRDFGASLGVEDINAVQKYLNYVRDLEPEGGKPFRDGVETSVGVPELNKDLWGTIDYWIAQDDRL